jgi:hypothetical protein
VVTFAAAGAVGSRDSGNAEVRGSGSAAGFAVLEEHFPELGAGGQTGTIVFQAKQGVEDPRVEAPARRDDPRAAAPRQPPRPHDPQELIMQTATPDYPVQFDVDYPEAPRNRLTSAFRLVLAVPILAVLGAIGTAGSSSGGGSTSLLCLAAGVLFLPPLLLIVARQKYPRWWFDFSVAYLRFHNRVVAYLLLLRDEYPSTDEDQAVHLDLPYPDVNRDLNRWMPLVKWFLAIPHYVVLVALALAVVLASIGAWFAILFTGRYPRTLFRFTVGCMRWHNRVVGYAFALVTDRYPPFRLSA